MAKKYKEPKEYNVKNIDKYEGNLPVIYRSTWEFEFMVYCDEHPNVIKWSSEPFKIPYSDPLTGKQRVYIPDFLITFLNSNKELITKLIEIKPIKEQLSDYAKNAEDALIQAKNRAKWGAAIAWCARRGIEFVVMNETNLFNGYNNMKPRKKPIKEYGSTVNYSKKSTKKVNNKKIELKSRFGRINK